MSRSSHRERTTRLNAARVLLDVHQDLSKAADALVNDYRLSKRQAYRYLEEARYLKGPLPLPDTKITFTLKVSQRLVEALRQRAEKRGIGLSELVTQILERWLGQGRHRG